MKEVSNLLANNGFNEILNNSLTKKEHYESLEEDPKSSNIELLNPLSQDLNILRRNLLFGGLESIVRNQNMKNPNLKFFEFGGNYESTPKTFKRKELCRSPANAKKSGMLER